MDTEATSTTDRMVIVVLADAAAELDGRPDILPVLLRPTCTPSQIEVPGSPGSTK